LDKYKNSEISTVEIEIIYAICKEYFGFRIPGYMTYADYSHFDIFW